MKLVILDIVSNNYGDIKKYENIFSNNEVLALTPSSFYYLENQNILFKSFHNLLSIEQFQSLTLAIYEDTLKNNYDNKYFKCYFRNVSQVICQLLTIDKIQYYIEINNFENIIYITDRKIENYLTLENLTNDVSLLNNFIEFAEILHIKKNIIQNKVTLIDKIKKYSISQLLKKLYNKIFIKDLKYDWFELNISSKKVEVTTKEESINFDIDTSKMSYIKKIKLNYIMQESKSNIFNLLTFMEKEIFNKVVNFKNLDLYFFQHGSYLYKNLFIKYSEIEYAKINFVFNDYTKKLFENLGAKKVFSVGSMLFNKPIKERKKEYDFLYITQGHDYLGNLQYLDFPNSLHSFDGYELYQRHKSIIELFGTKFKDKKIIIRVHPTVLTNGVYVPFWELAESYTNITLDVSIPIHTLIEKSNFIISDYFTSEFINRELHYKRDILLFQGAPTPIPEEIIEDMKKMFILVDTVEDLEEKVKNIEIITKDRPRYDNIIEHYSSKECDTKKVVTEILKKELNARNNS
ncbi:hypothetical protein [Aliarcobacter butzleri]|uniref:hypothetical protein n=1 Tax=Aliarcobacter butzleri TaxID=28197 RepID=UPI00263C8D62|nr:hypothetical protein [Aliarcobacter butzleri]MDN5054604.1 hypothetical protein [Aliarcobacter butzleri]